MASLSPPTTTTTIPVVSTSNTVSMAITIPASWSKGEQLGVGELYSKVFLCHHQQQNDHKVVVKEIICMDPNDSLNLEKRIESLKALQHDHIVQYYGTERSDNNISVFIEYIPGGSLYQHLQQCGSLDKQLSRKYTKQLLDGVEYLHRKGFVHGRIKCTNILVDSRGNIKVTDYGVSKQLHDIDVSNSKHNACMVVNGYWKWTPHELIVPHSVSQDSVDYFKCDVWSIGCTVVEMLTGHPPYHDLTPFAGVYKIATEPMTFDLSSHNNTEYIHSFLQCCFSQDVASRPTVVELLKHEFVNVLASAASDGRGTGRDSSEE